MSARPRVVITGVGVVNAAVIGASPALGTWLADPRPAPRLALGGHASTVPLPSSALAGLMDAAEARRLSRVCQLTIAAARLALAESGIDPARGLGIVVGSELGDFASTVQFADGFLKRGPGGLSALLFPNTVMNTMAATTAIAVTAREMALTLNAPTVAGELAVARATAAVGSGRLDAVLAGGVDEADPYLAGALTTLGAGDVRGEGAAFLVLEAEAAARARGATILGEIVAAVWRTLPASPWGCGRTAAPGALAAALDAAALMPADVGWVYRSSSGDRVRDAWERAVLERTLGAPGPPATSLAALVGHHAGLGALRVAAAAWTARSGLLPAAGGDPGGARAATGVAHVPPGRGVVHGLARGGTHVALVVGAA